MKCAPAARCSFSKTHGCVFQIARKDGQFMSCGNYLYNNEKPTGLDAGIVDQWHFLKPWLLLQIRLMLAWAAVVLAKEGRLASKPWTLPSTHHPRLSPHVSFLHTCTHIICPYTNLLQHSIEKINGCSHITRRDVICHCVIIDYSVYIF